MKITILEDFRNLKKGWGYDFSILKESHFLGIVGPNGCGKSSLLQALRGTFNSKPTKSLYEGDFKKLAQFVEIAHGYERIFFFDRVKDSGNDFMVSYDASEYLKSGGFHAQRTSHGESSALYLNKFFSEIKDQIIPDKTLIVLDEPDSGASLVAQAEFFKIIVLLSYKFCCDCICATHNPFLIHKMGAVFDFQERQMIPSDDYIKKTTGFEIRKAESAVE